MGVFKIIFRIIVGSAIFLGVCWIINYLFVKNEHFFDMYFFYLNMLEILILMIFILVMFYNRLFRKIPFSFFKTELIYLFTQIIVWILLAFSSGACPTCAQ